MEALENAIMLIKEKPIYEYSGSKFSNRLGGLPFLPNSIGWPTWDYNGRSVPLHHIAQVDCASLPEVADRERLPRIGGLSFFYLGNSVEGDCNEDAPAPGRVIYSAIPTESWRLREPPRDLTPLMIEQIDGPEYASLCFGRWSVSLASLVTYDSKPPEFPEEGYHEHMGQLRDEQVLRALAGGQSQYCLTAEARAASYNSNYLLGYPMMHQAYGSSRNEAWNKIKLVDSKIGRKSKPSELSLLAQFDTCYSGTGFMFGDCGKLHFWILAEDMASGAFSSAVGVVDAT